jgi:hypothetical protein
MKKKSKIANKPEESTHPFTRSEFFKLIRRAVNPRTPKPNQKEHNTL